LWGCLHDGDGIVVEDGRHILRGELVGGVGDEQAGLADSSISDDDAPWQDVSMLILLMERERT
jgi:hypothetical protein